MSLSFLVLRVDARDFNYSSGEVRVRIQRRLNPEKPSLTAEECRELADTMLAENSCSLEGVELPDAEVGVHEDELAYFRKSFPDIGEEWRLVAGYQVFVNGDEDTVRGYTLAFFLDPEGRLYKLSAEYSGYWYNHEEFDKTRMIMTRWPHKGWSETLEVPGDFFPSEAWVNEIEPGFNGPEVLLANQILDRYLGRVHPGLRS